MPPYVTKQVVDQRGAGAPSEDLMYWAGLAALAFLLQQILNSLRILLNNTFEQR